MPDYELRVKLQHVKNDDVRQGVLDYVAEHGAIPTFCWEHTYKAVRIVDTSIDLAVIEALRLVVSMHAMPDGMYRDKIGAMNAAHAAIKAYKERAHA